MLIGKGSDLNANEYGKRKCKKKAVTQALVLRLADIARKSGREDLRLMFWNTWHCQNKVSTHDGKLFSKYCKNRFCTVCQSIRKAEMINKYYPVLQSWQDAQFLTLTVKACSKNMLNTMLRKCLQGINRIIDKYDKRAYRGKGKKLIGIRSLECNFNPIKRTYNPHLHMIVPDRETAEIFIKEWLAIWSFKNSAKKPLADRKGQFYRPVKNMGKDLIEVIKYNTKVFTDPKDDKKPTGIVKLYARAFYNIVAAMQGIRLFGTFGIKLPKTNKEPTPARIVTDYEEWQYIPEYNNWQHTENELTLFGYTIDEILNNCWKIVLMIKGNK